EQNVRSKAAGVGDIAGRFDSIAMQLRQTVDERTPGSTLAMPKVLAQVNDLDGLIERILFEKLDALPVPQAEERDVHIFAECSGKLDIGLSQQVAMHCGNGLISITPAVNKSNLNIGMV